MDPEDLCNLVHVNDSNVWRLKLILNAIVHQVLSKVNNLNVEPAVPYAYTVYLENLSRNVILT